jgi:hypothetical protein
VLKNPHAQIASAFSMRQRRRDPVKAETQTAANARKPTNLLSARMLRRKMSGAHQKLSKIVHRMPAETTTTAQRPPVSRSRVSNGNSLFVEPTDQRSRHARRFRDVYNQCVEDMGGPDDLSEGQRQLIRRVALLSVQCEAMEAASVAGQPIDLEQYGKLTDRIGRAFQRLGLRRRPRDVTTLGQILQSGGHG